MDIEPVRGVVFAFVFIDAIQTGAVNGGTILSLHGSGLAVEMTWAATAADTDNVTKTK